MKIKKFLCTILAVILSNLTCCMEANALFGNTHLNLGKKIIEQSNIKLSKSEEKAFLSGLVYADIGRFKFDKEIGINSDSIKFVSKLKELAITPEEKWFARGFEIHVFQDKNTEKYLNNIIGKKSCSYSQYIINCSLLDSYFLKSSGELHNEFLDKFNFEQVSAGIDIENLSKTVGIPKNKIKDFVLIVLDKCSSTTKQSLVIYDNLIKNTYNSLGLNVSIESIHEQAANIVGAFIATTAIAKKTKIPEELAYKIEKESKILANMCISNFLNDEN